MGGEEEEGQHGSHSTERETSKLPGGIVTMGEEVGGRNHCHCTLVHKVLCGLG
jgi:hypothetical protein